MLEAAERRAQSIVRAEYINEALNAWKKELADGGIDYKPAGSDGPEHRISVSREDIVKWAGEASSAGRNLQQHIEARLNERYEPIARKFREQKEAAIYRMGGAWGHD